MSDDMRAYLTERSKYLRAELDAARIQRERMEAALFEVECALSVLGKITDQPVQP